MLANQISRKRKRAQNSELASEGSAKEKRDFSFSSPPAPFQPQKKPQLSSLQEKYQKKLEGARFRSINESLYTKKGNEAFLEFQENPALFEIYHQGFRFTYF